MTTTQTQRSSQDLIAAARQCLTPNYGERDIVFVRGEGPYVFTPEDERYLDFLCGLAVTSVGHCHPHLVDALREQAGRLLHVSNLYLIEPQVRLAEMLCERSFASKAFFCNSGAEAMESAIKCARRFHDDPARHHIVTMKQSFHGRTLATISATGQDRFHQQGFDPYMPGFSFVELNDIEALSAAVNEQTAAVIFEPVQAEGGVHVANADFATAARELCDKTGALLVFDEVQCGMGRCGSLWAHERLDVEPDMMGLAKALGGGIPIGALLCNEKTADVFAAGTHGSTFGGNPLSAAAACAVLEIYDAEELVDNSRCVGLHFQAELKKLAARHDVITDVRGDGLLQGIELSTAAAPVMKAMRERNILVGTAGQNVVRFTPPLTVTTAMIDDVLATLDTVLSEVQP